jgi:hypothetical protein
MKNSILLLVLFCFLGFGASAQTKKPVSTAKKAPVPVKKVAPKPVAKKPIYVATPPVATPTPPPPPPRETPEIVVEEVKESGPPVTGPIGSGPKSYENTSKKTTTTKTTTAKPVKVAKEEKVVEKKSSTKVEKTKVAKVEKTKAPKVDKIRVPSEDRKRSYIGIRGGYNLSTVEGIKEIFATSGIGTGGPKDLPGYMGGLVINLGLSKAISIQPEFLYSQQGLQFADGPIYLQLQQEIVNVPLLLKVAVGSPKIKFFVNAGPYIGYKIGQKSISNFTGTKVTEKVTIEKEFDATTGEKDNIFDFGAIGGAGLQFNLGGPLIVLEGRYQYGLADPTIYKDGKDATIPKAFGHQRIMTGTLGILFPLGGK